MMPLWSAVKSYCHARSFRHRFRDRAALENYQAKRLAAWLKHDVPKVDAFSGVVGGCQLPDLPIMDKAALMADFSRYNTQRIGNAGAWAAFEGTKKIGEFVVGASTGTSGNRGLFIISPREQFAWLGAILAKAVPDFWRRRERVAVMLPIDTPLYDSANRTRRLKLNFFDISNPVDFLLDDLTAFDPTIIIAPPRILRKLTATKTTLKPRLVFSGAEKLEAFDRDLIEEGLGVPVREIYMATEGLLGVSCTHGKMHLSEDCMHFEFEPSGDGLVMPIISDFSRSTQIMARYRLNDLLRLDDAPCACGSPLQVVSEIVGRMDDVFCLAGADGEPVEVTPDILRNVIVDSSRSIEDFKLVQTGAKEIQLRLPSDCSEVIKDAVKSRLHELLMRHGVVRDVVISSENFGSEKNEKLRRVERRWRG